MNVRILLVEDNPVNQEVALTILQSFGCLVDVAGDGLQALKKLESAVYDLVFMDCMMPEMDGYAATAEIRYQQNAGILPHFPIIAMTANTIEGDKEKCLLAGMDDYLSKPFKSEVLLQLINSWLKLNKQSAFILETSDSASLPDINVDALKAIAKLVPRGGNELVQHVIKLYLENTSNLLVSLDQAWHAGDVNAIRINAHSLKSSSNQVGANILANLCQNVENEARNQCYDTSMQTLTDIHLQFSKTRTALEIYLKSSPPIKETH